MSYFELSATLDPFMDAEGNTYISSLEGGATEARVIRLNSRLARMIVKAHLCWLGTKGIATESQVRSACDVLEAMAFSRPRREPMLSAEDILADCPLAQAVIAVTRTGGAKKKVPELLMLLYRVACREGIQIDRETWPANEDSLGKQLAGLVNPLAKAGIELTRHGNDRPRTWSIKCTEPQRDGRDGNVSVTNVPAAATSENPVTCAGAGDEVAADDVEHVSDDEINQILNS